MVCEAVENQALEGDADHELLLGRGGLPGRGHKFGYDLVSPVEHLRGGDARLATILGHPGAGHVTEFHRGRGA